MSDGIRFEYVCPLTRETCFNATEIVKENPFTGSQTVQQCAWGTRDGNCAVAKLMDALYSFSNRGGY